MTATEAPEGGINLHYPDSSQATSEAGRMSQEFVEDPEFKVQLTDALAGAIHLHSIGHRRMFCHVLIPCLIIAAISLLHI